MLAENRIKIYERTPVNIYYFEMLTGFILPSTIFAAEKFSLLLRRQDISGTLAKQVSTKSIS